MAKVKKKKLILKRSAKPPAIKAVKAQIKAAPSRKNGKGEMKSGLRKLKPSKSNGAIREAAAKPVAKVVAKPAPKALPPKPLTAELQQIRTRLMQMLTELRRDIDNEFRGASERDLAHINDTSDMASDAAEGDLSLRIAESETAEAGEVQRAIEKIDAGTYGMCEMCNKVIGADRLQFLPYVTLCIKCQELAEIRKREEGEELDDLAEGSEADNEG